MKQTITKTNDRIAIYITIIVSSMWAFYFFVIFGLLPVIWPQYEETILYWSNFLQLIFLPVITVGAAIMGRSTEKRAQEDHAALMTEFKLIKSIVKENKALESQLHILQEKMDKLLQK